MANTGVYRSGAPLPTPTVLDLELCGDVDYEGTHEGLQNLCLARNVYQGDMARTTRNKHLQRILDMLQKSHTQAVVYDAFDWRSLREFVEARGLSKKLNVAWDELEVATTARDKVQAEVEAIEEKRYLVREEKRKRKAARTKERQLREKKEQKKIQEVTMKVEKARAEGAPRRSIRLAMKDEDELDDESESPKGSLIPVAEAPTITSTSTPTNAPSKKPVVFLGLPLYKLREIAEERSASAAKLENEVKVSIIPVLEADDRDSQFNFLALPPEIRTMVYYETCKANSTLLYPKQPAITKTCHLLRAESLPVFYGSNRFGVVVDMDNRWLQETSTVKLTLIRSFEFFNLHDKNLGPIGTGFQVDFKSRRQEYTIKCQRRYWVVGRRRSFNHYLREMALVGKHSFEERRGDTALFKSVIEKAVAKNAAQCPVEGETDSKILQRSLELSNDFDLECSRRGWGLKLLGVQWKLAQGFSAAGVESIVKILAQSSDSDVTKLWSCRR